MPDWRHEIRARLASLRLSPTREAEIVDELSQHLDDRYEELLAGGVSPGEAARAAFEEFESQDTLARYMMPLRQAHVSTPITPGAPARSWLTGLWQDVRYAARSFWRRPAFSLAIVLTLALGIGATTMIFSVINDTLLKPLPFPNSDRLVLVWATYGSLDNRAIVSAPDYWDFKRQSTSFEDMAIFDSAGRGYNLSASGTKQESEQVSGVRVSASFFRVLGVKPLLGRTFLPEEETPGNDHEVVLSYGLWKRRYGGDPTLVGKTIRIDAEDFTVVGVMPARFAFQFWSGPRQLWVPVGYTKGDYNRASNNFIAFARLKPGVTVARARQEMDAIGHRLAREYPKADPGMGATVTPMASYGMTGLRQIMFVLLAAVAFVLLIACVNVASLLLVRGAARQKEFAIRCTLGAQGWRLARQLLTESLLLAVAGGAGGLLFAVWGTRMLPHILPIESLHLPLRPVEAITLDVRVFGFALFISCLAGVLSGLAPALGVWRGDVSEPLKSAGRGSSRGAGTRVRRALVAAEVALALILLCGAGLMIESMARLLGVDSGLDAKNVLTMQMSLPQENLYNGPPGIAEFCQDLDERVGAIPGVMSAGAVAHLPFRGGAGRSFQIEGRAPADPEHMPNADYSVACPNYFQTMGIPVLEGREFTRRDTLTSPGVIVINETMAARDWPGQDPIGKAIRLGRSGGLRLTVIGVVGNVHRRGLDEGFRPQFFRPYTQAAWPVMNIVVRTASAPAAFAPSIKKALSDVLPDRPVSAVQTMEDIVQRSTVARRFPMFLLSTFALLALILAAVGTYGVVAYSASQRTHEIGIRMALGAQRQHVLALVVGEGMTLVLIGAGMGVVAALGLMRFMSSLLYGVRPDDPLSLAAVSVILAMVGLVACYLPARRAAKVDPMLALRDN